MRQQSLVLLARRITVLVDLLWEPNQSGNMVSAATLPFDAWTSFFIVVDGHVTTCVTTRNTVTQVRVLLGSAIAYP